MTPAINVIIPKTITANRSGRNKRLKICEFLDLILIVLCASFENS